MNLFWEPPSIVNIYLPAWLAIAFLAGLFLWSYLSKRRK